MSVHHDRIKVDKKRENPRETEPVDSEGEEPLPTLEEALALEQLKTFMLQNLELSSKLKLRLGDQELEKVEEIEQLTVYDFQRHDERDGEEEEGTV